MLTYFEEQKEKIERPDAMFNLPGDKDGEHWHTLCPVFVSEEIEEGAAILRPLHFQDIRSKSDMLAK